MFCYVTSLITVKSSWSAALTIIVSQADLSTHCVLMMSVCFVSFWYFTSLLSRLVFFVFFPPLLLVVYILNHCFFTILVVVTFFSSPAVESKSVPPLIAVEMVSISTQCQPSWKIYLEYHTHTHTCHARAHTVKEMINQATFFNAEQIRFDNVALIPVHSSKISHTLIRGFYKPYFSDYPTLFVLEPSGPAPNGWSIGPH